MGEAVYIEDLYQMWRAGDEYLPTVGDDYSDAKAAITRIESERVTAFDGYWRWFEPVLEQVWEPLEKAFGRTSDWCHETGAALVDTVNHYREADGWSAEVMERIEG